MRWRMIIDPMVAYGMFSFALGGLVVWLFFWLWLHSQSPEPDPPPTYPGFDSEGYLPEPLPEWVEGIDLRL